MAPLIGGAFRALAAKTSPETPLYFVFYDHNAYAVIGDTRLLRRRGMQLPRRNICPS